MRPFMAVLAAGLIIVAQPAQAQFLPKGFDDDPHTITEGGKFGVDIGMSRDEARQALERHWNIRFDMTYPCREGPYDEKTCFSGSVIDSYNVGGDWRGGVIQLYIHDDKVVQIVWWPNPVDP